jgi:hypothetical protein
MKYTSKALDLNRKLDIWNELEEKGEVTYCKKCGNRIWKYWKRIESARQKEMTLCGPCYFKK